MIKSGAVPILVQLLSSASTTAPGHIGVHGCCPTQPVDLPQN